MRIIPSENLPDNLPRFSGHIRVRATEALKAQMPEKAGRQSNDSLGLAEDKQLSAEDKAALYLWQQLHQIFRGEQAVRPNLPRYSGMSTDYTQGESQGESKIAIFGDTGGGKERGHFVALNPDGFDIVFRDDKAVRYSNPLRLMDLASERIRWEDLPTQSADVVLRSVRDTLEWIFDPKRTQALTELFRIETVDAEPITDDAALRAQSEAVAKAYGVNLDYPDLKKVFF